MADLSQSSAEQQDAPGKASPPRKLGRDARRLQLIEATIETIATLGYARTTLGAVAAKAGLSHGLVNFHFQTKEDLLAETLGHLSEGYRRNWADALDRAGPDPARRLDEMLRADFDPAVYTPSRLAAWCAFWGESQSRPLYRDISGPNDAAYVATFEAVVSDLDTAGGYGHDPARVARVLRVTVEGVWLDRLTLVMPYSAAEALATVHTCAAAFFPGHFDASGLRAA